MNNPKELLERNFPTAGQDVNAASAVKPSLYAGADSSYDLAFADQDFLLHPDLRPVRMHLELLKPEMIQREEGIDSTIVVFGSACISWGDWLHRRPLKLVWDALHRFDECSILVCNEAEYILF